MTVFWINLAAVTILSIFSRQISNANYPTLTTDYIRPNRVFVVLVAVVLILVSGLRNNISDTIAYMHSYRINHYTWDKINFARDFGFDILQMFLQFISRDPQLLIFITALITNALIIIVFYKYSRLFDISIYIYITSGLFLTSMNGLRQFLASAIIFSATKYLMNGNWKIYFLVVLFATTIHKSALILIPIYFIAKRKAWTHQTLILLMISVFIVVGFSPFMSVLFSVLDNTQYGHYESFTEGGANVLRVAVIALPLIIAFIARKKLSELYPQVDCIINMALINFVFMVISTQNWIFARFSIYFGLYHVILVSWIIHLFKEKDRKLIYYLILVFYFAYYYYECVITFGTTYRSDYIPF